MCAIALCAVDGHYGRQAAEFCAQNLLKFLTANNSGCQGIPSAAEIQSRTVALDAAFRESLSGAQCKAGSTAVFAFIAAPTLQTAASASSAGFTIRVGSVGDSRALLLPRDGGVRQVSVDHKPDVESECKRITAAGGHERNGRVDGDLNVSRAIGDFWYKRDNKRAPTEQKIIALPDVFDVAAQPGDVLLLASAGAFQNSSNETIAEVNLDRAFIARLM